MADTTSTDRAKLRVQQIWDRLPIRLARDPRMVSIFDDLEAILDNEVVDFEAAEFVSAVASNAIVQDDFDEAVPCLQEIVRDAREVADELGLPYVRQEEPEPELADS